VATEPAKPEQSRADAGEPGVAVAAQLDVDGDDLVEQLLVPALGAAQRAIRPLGKWLAWLFVPPVIGLGLIAMVVFNLGDSQVTKSAATASVALVIGALLLLGSAALFVFSPRRYDLFFTDLRKRLQGQSGPTVRAQAIAGAAPSQQALPTGQGDANRDAGMSAQVDRSHKGKKKRQFWKR
jgi:hypothetical protein